uniref:Uncharacterized protein n=1 Tax=Anguilla anguilla TaxID=7936 RepID=A0A0E9WRK9_ANGAN
MFYDKMHSSISVPYTAIGVFYLSAPGRVLISTMCRTTLPRNGCFCGVSSTQYEYYRCSVLCTA